MSRTLDQLLESLWQDYAAINPQAQRIHQLLTDQGEQVVNDHIAFRTFNLPRIDRSVIAKPFEALGYIACGDYVFKEKKLLATHYEHADAAQPKIFISELRVEQLSPAAQAIIHGLVEQIELDLPQRDDFLVAGRPWRLSFTDYRTLAQESEYAGWLAAHGFRPNHFTVSVNHLRKFADLAALNAFLRDHDFALNTVGGEIKGGPNEYLAQSSTLAAPVEVDFTDGRHSIPGCYYEFAQRYTAPNGQLFQGFVAQSADKIFESTDRQPQL